MNDGAHPGWVCDCCSKHVTGSMPIDQCVDCGGHWLVATPERLACERCGDLNASRVLYSREYNRLCIDCIEWKNLKNN